MDEKDIIFIEQLLYSTDKDYVLNQLKNIDKPLLLHYFAANYNWNSGFEAPTVILENENCDLGTGLLMFHYADGYRLLESSDEFSSSSLMEWKGFLRKIYNKLLNLDFQSQNISFDPELSKIQKYKLKKNNPEIPDVLISKSPGEEIDIPKI
ncbi:DUF4274 domain-containing protein [Virgibacillus pantothenticus]|uniref:DUF4274 domain-containing protein n=1 Tax=Virgibacillus pantothenticus TaxID=1473 RepID=UPI001C220B14|nr:DUF4274 domain-containing protein [Virgibacillus pantothenticus]MBU8568307.1 DUF4274 domain-containing protein [Virgibacillus pantothenticus]MBU8602212.1 DUF4274 domain-containing protein [Virgibacillus pantothenticus]MBU8636444.1 DUF4274 domain-containing protein [Virgibacillus pantothenticus]MBU8644082.1 DUF4274 domain-containing protein [Virgibacillus pantothenticus]MBU8648321.1 DUF4274 domain-containing protein [Virgibacillus pantothenticus]